MADWSINEGDEVKVFFTLDGTQFCRGVVRHIPQATGDAWIIDNGDGFPVYVQTYSRMVRLSCGKPSTRAE